MLKFGLNLCSSSADVCRFNHVNACVVHLKVPHSTCFVKFVFSVALKVILRMLSSCSEDVD